MTIELSRRIEDELRSLAEKEGRDVNVLVEDAVRQYVEAAAITDIDQAAVGETQMALTAELPPSSDWKAPRL